MSQMLKSSGAMAAATLTSRLLGMVREIASVRLNGRDLGVAWCAPRMVEKLKKTGRGAWLDEEMERLADTSSFAFPPEDAWKRLKFRPNRCLHTLAGGS